MIKKFKKIIKKFKPEISCFWDSGRKAIQPWIECLYSKLKKSIALTHIHDLGFGRVCYWESEKSEIKLQRMCICVWFKQSNLTKLLAWCSRLIPPFLLRHCDWSNHGGLMVCCNLRGFFSDSQEWSGWGSCRHNCCANLELISEPKVEPIKYPNILLLKEKNIKTSIACFLVPWKE